MIAALPEERRIDQGSIKLCTQKSFLIVLDICLIVTHMVVYSL